MAEVAQRYGPYTCVRRLGAGGMAETFLAVQQGAAGFEQRVCMKFILPAYRNDPGFRRLFLREATIAASLRHSNIVGVIDLDADDGYIVLELVDGVDLRTLLMATAQRRLSPAQVTLIAIELLKALAYAHGRMRRGRPDGIVHRDISPSNVMISHSGEVKLTDFGVAKAMRSDGEPASTSIKGKLCYMAPEQTHGEPLDGRADQFSLGIMLFELLAGVRPFDGATDAQTLLRIDAGLHPPLLAVAPDVAPQLAAIIERMLRRLPEQRFASAEECIDALVPHAPAITVCRELGQLARQARAPETLSTGDFVVTPASGSRPLAAPRSPAARPAPASARTERTHRRGADGAPTHTAPMARPSAHAARGAGRVSGQAWIALAGSLLVASGVGVGWLTRRDATQPLPHAAASPNPATSSTRTPSLARAQREGEGPNEDARPQHSPLVAPDLPRSQTIAAAANGTRLPDLRATRSGARAASAAEASAKTNEAASAVLRVGTVPIGQVWIDGQAAGWAPVLLTLAPGVHSVAGGSGEPEVKRSVRLRAGETKQLVLNLEDDTASAAGEIGVPLDSR